MLEGDSINTVQDGREESECVAEKELGGGFAGEWMRDRGTSSGKGYFGGRFSWGGQVGVGDKDDANEGGKDTKEFADGESLRAGAGADEESPDGGGRGEDCGGGDGRVL